MSTPTAVRTVNAEPLAPEAFEAFVVPGDRAVQLHRGTWQENPIPLTDGQVVMATSHQALTRGRVAHTDASLDSLKLDVEKRNVTETRRRPLTPSPGSITVTGRATREELAPRLAVGADALALLEAHLERHVWLVGHAPTIADASVWAHAHLAGEVGLATVRSHEAHGVVVVPACRP